jgi:hypothetical protein
MRLLVLILVLLAVFAGMSSSAAAGATWSPELQVNQDDAYDDYYPQIAVDTSGTPWIVWMGLDPVQLDEEIYWSSWQNGSWTCRERLHTDNNVNDRFSEIAAGKLDGVPWVVWARYNPGSGKYDFLVSRRVGLAWAEPETVFTAGARWDEYDIVARDTSLVWVVWSTRTRGGSGDRDVFARKRENGAWGDIEQVVKGDTDDWRPRVDLDSTGNLWVVWDATNLAFSAVRTDTGWTVPVIVEYQPPSAIGPSITIDDDSVPWVVWQGGNAYGGTDVLSARWQSDHWEYVGMVNVPDDPEDIDNNPVIMSVPSSGPLVIWWGGLPRLATSMDIYESKWTAYGWRQEARVSTPDSVFLALDEQPSVAVTRAGRAWVCWQRMGKVAPYDYDIWARYSDDVVPVEGVRGFGALAGSDGVRLSWESDDYGWFEVYRASAAIGAPSGQSQAVSRSALDSSLSPCQSLLPPATELISDTSIEGKGKLVFVDSGVTSGNSYRYWLGRLGAQDCHVYGPVRVDVPGSVIPAQHPASFVASPNPFRSACVVRSSSGNTARVFDLHGRFVRELCVSEETTGATEGGYVSFFWDGTDKSGKEVASGVYVVKVSDEHDPKGKEVIGKVIFLR